MAGLARKLFDKPEVVPADPDRALIRSYYWILIVIGIIGFLLPIVFVAIEAIRLPGGVQVRGSISAYYHTLARDFFVAGLGVTGFLLALYKSGEAKSFDFWLSLVAGIAVLIVVFFPTSRPNLEPGDPGCGTEPTPAGCSLMQQWFGETVVAGIHFAAAVVFILSLAWMAFIFAGRSETEHQTSSSRIQKGCGWAILGAIVLVIIGGFLGFTVGPLTPLYLGELIAVWAFGISWLLAALNYGAARDYGLRTAI